MHDVDGQTVLQWWIEASINEHRVLIAAILAGDAARAERAMHDPLLTQLAALKHLRTLESQGQKYVG